jgi:hypothetical protein
MNHFCKILFAVFLFFNIQPIIGQEADTIRKIGFSGIPIIASSPETGFKYGAFSQISFDLYKNNLESRPSQAKIGMSYSVKKQFSIETGFQLFGKDENYFINGGIEYVNWIDRHYGLGNDASNQIVEYDFENNRIDTFNFLNYSLDIFSTKLSYNKKIRDGLFVGVLTNFYSGTDYKALADSIGNPSAEIIGEDMVGQYLGVGLNVIYDTRDNINNSSTGTYIQFSNLNHRKWLGADFEFYSLSLDVRKFFKVVKDQVFAVRFFVANTFSDDVIPYTGYQRLGGKRTLRGYYEGTYLDKNVVSFDAEYRLPLFHDESAPTYKLWKHAGIVGFVSVGQVYNKFSDFDFSAFRFSAGGGLRLLLSKEQRTNIRFDYGIGFQENAGGIGKKQRGFYITVNETF